MLRNLYVWTFYLNFSILTLKLQFHCNELPPSPPTLPSPLIHTLFFPCSCPERMSQYVSEHTAWADKIYCRFMNLRTDYQKLEHRKKPGQLTAQQLWKLKHLSYLKRCYKQCHKSVKDYQGSGAVGGAAITSTEPESDDDQEPELENEDRGHESSSSSRKETPTKIPVLSSPLPLRKPKKRRDTEKRKSHPASTSSWT